MPHREAYAGDPRQPVGQQLLPEGLGGPLAAVEFEQEGEVLGGVRAVEADEVALPCGGLGRFVVEPDGGAGPADGVGAERDRVTGGVPETGGDLAQAGVEVLLTGDVGLGDLGAGARRAVVAGAGARPPARGAVRVSSSGPVRVSSPVARSGRPSSIRAYDRALRGTVSM